MLSQQSSRLAGKSSVRGDRDQGTWRKSGCQLASNLEVVLSQHELAGR